MYCCEYTVLTATVIHTVTYCQSMVSLHAAACSVSISKT